MNQHLLDSFKLPPPTCQHLLEENLVLLQLFEIDLIQYLVKKFGVQYLTLEAYLQVVVA